MIYFIFIFVYNLFLHISTVYLDLVKLDIWIVWLPRYNAISFVILVNTDNSYLYHCSSSLTILCLLLLYAITVSLILVTRVYSFILSCTYFIMLTYNNYLFSKIDSKFTSNFAFTEPSRTSSNSLYDFQFCIVPEEESIRRQANVFGRYVSGTGYFTNSFFDNAYRLDQADKLLSDAYMYSYVKAVWFSCIKSLAPGSVATFPRKNLVFKGHKVLYDHVLEGVLCYQYGYTSTINLEIKALNDSLDGILDFSVFEQWFDKEIGIVYNQKMETVLNFCMTRCSGLLHVSDIGGEPDNSVKNINSSPLGNSCYSKNMQTFQYIEKQGITSDLPSFFWGKACMITELLIESVDITDSIYDDIPIDRYNMKNLAQEVRAITGYNLLRTSSYYSKNPNNSNTPLGPSNNPTDPGSSGSGGKNNGQRNNRNSNKNQSNNRNNRKDSGDNLFKSVLQVSSKAVKYLKDIHAVLSDDNVRIVANVISDIIGRKISASTLERYKGTRLKDIYLDYGIPQIEDNEEYNAFYIENNGDKVDLVAYPKAIGGSRKR